MTLSLDLDALEICWCKRLICNDADCDVLRRLADGEFYDHRRAEEPDITVEKWTQWQALQARKTSGVVA